MTKEAEAGSTIDLSGPTAVLRFLHVNLFFLVMYHSVASMGAMSKLVTGMSVGYIQPEDASYIDFVGFLLAGIVAVVVIIRLSFHVPPLLAVIVAGILLAWTVITATCDWFLLREPWSLFPESPVVGVLATIGGLVAAILITWLYFRYAVPAVIGTWRHRTFRIFSVAYRSPFLWGRGSSAWFVFRHAEYGPREMLMVAGVLSAVACLATSFVFAGLVSPIGMVWFRRFLKFTIRKLRATITDPLAAITADRKWPDYERVHRDETEQRGFALYLRSFEDDKLQIEEPRVRGFLKEIGLQPLTDETFEEKVVSRAWGKSRPVLSVGIPETSAGYGAVRVSTGEKPWQETVEALSAGAEHIIVMPGYTEGIRWELRHVLGSQYASRTILVFPPEVPEARKVRWQAASPLSQECIQSSIVERTLAMRQVAGAGWIRCIGHHDNVLAYEFALRLLAVSTDAWVQLSEHNTALGHAAPAS